MYAFCMLGAAMTFQDMVMTASKGVLHYAGDDLKGKNLTSRVGEDQSSNDSGVHLHVASCVIESSSQTA